MALNIDKIIKTAEDLGFRVIKMGSWLTFQWSGGGSTHESTLNTKTGKMKIVKEGGQLEFIVANTDEDVINALKMMAEIRKGITKNITHSCSCKSKMNNSSVYNEDFAKAALEIFSILKARKAEKTEQ